ncbi:FBD-associated F-box protein At5g22730-like [Herrania umbratica]|uniref:FBD-associated F-box protein At5g22730-like n=1 Tax=Herrania umbratica TaxID=108875 RepID=A0A6J1B5P9_9ROSI|nr:FBD-associated F-box protein At5g22730-like [Herrania umbratica]
MERECDRISNLPDPLLEHILTFLPTKYAIRTGVLSKRWKGLWVSQPYISLSHDGLNGRIVEFKNLSIRDRTVKVSKYKNFFDKILLHPQARVKKLQISAPERLEALEFNRWFQAIMKEGLEELNLDFAIFSDAPVSILTVCNTLVTLKLDFGALSAHKFPKSFYFPNLKTMQLCGFILANNFTYQLLQSKNLESLILTYFMFDLMSRDSMPDCFEQKKALPNLNYAQMNCPYTFRGEDSTHFFLKNMIDVVSNAKDLNLSLSIMEYLAHDDLPEFNNLKHIKLYVQSFHVRAMCYILQKALNLESLHIEFIRPYGNVPLMLEELRSCCSQANLKVIQMTNFILEEDLVLDLVKLILESTGSLKDIVIELVEQPTMNNFLRCQKLLKLPRISECCILHLKWDFNYSYYTYHLR